MAKRVKRKQNLKIEKKNFKFEIKRHLIMN